MNSIEKAIDSFFDLYGDIYDSANGLQVIWLRGNGVLISAPWANSKPEDDIGFSISFESKDYAGFIQAFKISSNVMAAIERISAEDLRCLYLEGKGTIQCSIGDDAYTLWFQKMGDSKMLVRDDYDTEHEINFLLDGPQEFVSYTSQYYKINRYVKERVTLNPGWAGNNSFVIN